MSGKNSCVFRRVAKSRDGETCSASISATVGKLARAQSATGMSDSSRAESNVGCIPMSAVVAFRARPSYYSTNVKPAIVSVALGLQGPTETPIAPPAHTPRPSPDWQKASPASWQRLEYRFPQGVSPFKVAGNACGNRTPDCQRIMAAVNADAAASARR